MNTWLFVIYSFITFLLLIGGALFWYLKNVDLNSDDLCDKGLIAFQKGDYEKAKELFLISIADDPNSKNGRYNLGLTLVRMHDYENASKCFLEALTFHPDDYDIRYNLGLVYFRMGDYIKARECFEKILETEFRDFDSLFNLALTCQMQKSYEEAVENYNKALGINEKDADCYYNLGIISFEQQDYPKALELFEQASSLAFGRADILFAALRCREELCPYETEEEGQAILHDYVKLSKYPDIPLDFDVFWARAYAKVGQLDKALEICNRATLSLPYDALVYRVLGLIKLVRSEFEEAKKALLRAVDLDINNPEGYNLLSYVFLQEDNQLEYVTYKTKYKELIAENTVNAG